MTDTEKPGNIPLSGPVYDMLRGHPAVDAVLMKVGDCAGLFEPPAAMDRYVPLDVAGLIMSIDVGSEFPRIAFAIDGNIVDPDLWERTIHLLAEAGYDISIEALQRQIKADGPLRADELLAKLEKHVDDTIAEPAGGDYLQHDPTKSVGKRRPAGKHPQGRAMRRGGR